MTILNVNPDLIREGELFAGDYYKTAYGEVAGAQFDAVYNGVKDMISMAESKWKDMSSLDKASLSLGLTKQAISLLSKSAGAVPAIGQFSTEFGSILEKANSGNLQSSDIAGFTSSIVGVVGGLAAAAAALTAGTIVTAAGAAALAAAAEVAAVAAVIGGALFVAGILVDTYWDEISTAIGDALDTLSDLRNSASTWLSDIFSSVSDFFTSAQSWRPARDPLIIDLDGDGIETVGIAAGVLFDHDADGLKQGTGWVGADDGLLVWDRDGNGTIDSGRELFGDNTLLADGTTRANDGFDALRVLDSNQDGKVDAADGDFASLRVWRDSNQDGISQAGELLTLQELGIASVGVTEREVNQNTGNGNRIGILSDVVMNGERRDVGNLWFAQDTFHREFTDHIAITEQAAKLPDMHGSGAVRDLREAASQSPELAGILEQFAAATTREAQLGLIDQLLAVWSTTSAFKDILERQADLQARHPLWHGTEYLGGTYVEVLENNQANQRLAILETFNGRAFGEFWLDEVRRVTGGTPGENTGDGTQFGNIYVLRQRRIVGEQQALLDQAYDALRQSVYQALLPQTRLRPYLDALSIEVGPDFSIKANASALTAKIEARIASDHVNGLIDLVELAHSSAASLAGAGFDIYGYLKTTLNSAQLTEAELANLAQVGLAIDSAGTAGQDVRLGNEQANSVSGGEGNDILFGQGGDDVLSGDGGDDVIQGGMGNDRLQGGNGRDVLSGEEGNDSLYAGAGDDRLSGGEGADTLHGGSGVNELVGGKGDDRLFDGDGLDTFVFARGDGQDRIEFDGVGPGGIIRLTGGILPTHVVLRREVQDLWIRIDGGTDSIRIVGYFTYDGTRRGAQQEIRFDNGESWNLDAVKAAVQVATAGADLLWGYGIADVLNGLAGDDSIEGGNGDDSLYGGDDNDVLVGEAGKDRLEGGSGDDVLNGGEDSDFLDGGVGKDTLAGEAGDDQLYGQAGDDRLTGGGGRDTLEGGDGKDLILGGDGDDQILDDSGDNELHGESGNDQIRGTGQLYGGDGDDRLFSSEGDDRLYGDDGQDELSGGDGNDELEGGAGDDILWAGAGNDRLVGGAGSDTFHFGRGDGQDFIVHSADQNLEELDVLIFEGGIRRDDVSITRSGASLLIRLNGSTDRVMITDYFLNDGNSPHALKEIRFADNTVLRVDDIKTLVQTTTEGDDALYAYSHGQELHGLGGNDALYGNHGADRLFGEAGVDSLAGAGGDDYLDGGEGDDTLEGGGGNDRLLGGLGIDRLHGDEGNDVLEGEAGNDFLSGGFGNDHLMGGVGDDSLVGLIGQDILDGGDGNDVLDGGSDQDVLLGGAGDDSLDGDAGDDLLQGGSGNDCYKYGRGWGEDVILDSSGTADRLVFDYDIAPSAVSFALEADGLRLRVAGEGGSVLLKDWGQSGADSVELIQFADGTTWSQAYITDQILGRRAPGTPGVTPDANLTAGQPFSVDLGPLMATPASGSGWTYSLRMADGLALPSWLSFNAGTGAINGTPAADSLGWLSVEVTATHSNGQKLVDTVVLDVNASGSVRGTAGNDALTGTSGDNVLVGYGGDDFIEDEFGSDRDTVYAGAGNDTVATGDGSDTIHSGSGKNYIYSGGGDDQIYAEGEGDQVWADAGNDRIQVTGSRAVVFGEAGDDMLIGGSESDTLNGGAGNDQINGGRGDDVMNGESGSDSFELRQGDGHDSIELSDSTTIKLLDVAAGTPLNASLTLRETPQGSEFGLKVCYGPDSSFFIPLGIYTRQDLGAADISSKLGSARVQFADGSQVSLSTIFANARVRNSEGDDMVVGAQAADILDGLGGNDLLAGFEGDDRLSGGAGNDALHGGLGADELRGGLGNDFLSGDSAYESYTEQHSMNDRLYGEEGNDELYGGFGGDQLDGGDGDDTLYGGRANERSFGQDPSADALSGGNGNDYLEGGYGDDTLNGDAGNDILNGGYDADTLNGGSGDDSLDGGDGNDRLSGGDGNDVLRDGFGDDLVSAGLGRDTVYGGYRDGNDRYAEARGDTAYEFSRDNGLDEISDEGGNDRYDLARGLEAYQYVRLGNDLMIRYSASEATTFKNWYVSADYRIETFRVPGANGNGWVELAASEIEARVTYNQAPVLVAPVADMDLGEGLLLSWTIPAGMFRDNDAGDSLRYQITLADGSALPAWLVFDEATSTLSGRAPQSAVGTLEIAVSALDPQQQSATDRIALRIADDTSLMSGSQRDDELTGTAQDDVIHGHEGLDRIDGGAGSDRLYGGDDYDVLSGGDGDDTLYGGNGGGDSMIGGRGDDVLRDSVGETSYRVKFGDGRDTLIDDDGANNRLVIGSDLRGRSLQFERSGQNLIIRYSDTDQVTVNDWFAQSTRPLQALEFTNLGAVTTYTAAEIDAKLFSNTAPQLALPMADMLAVQGQTIQFSLPVLFKDSDAYSQLSAYTVNQASGAALPSWLSYDAATRTFSGTPSAAGSLTIRVACTDQYGATVYDDFVLNTAAASAIRAGGTATANTLNGTSGADVMHGYDGNDTLKGAAGNDLVYGGNGNDSVNGDDGNDNLYGGEGLDTLNGGNGDDWLNGGAGADKLSGGANNDTLLAGDGDDSVVNGDAGNDHLWGGNGNDMLNGGSDHDRLYGDAGNDGLTGGTGNDVLAGGAGNDTYYFQNGWGKDVIDTLDSDNGVDGLVLQGTLTSTKLKFQRAGNDLEISFTGSTTDLVTVSNWFLGEAYQLNSLKAADGVTLTREQINGLVDRPRGGSRPGPQPGLAPDLLGEDVLDAHDEAWAMLHDGESVRPRIRVTQGGIAAMSESTQTKYCADGSAWCPPPAGPTVKGAVGPDAAGESYEPERWAMDLPSPILGQAGLVSLPARESVPAELSLEPAASLITEVQVGDKYWGFDPLPPEMASQGGLEPLERFGDAFLDKYQVCGPTTGHPRPEASGDLGLDKSLQQLVQAMSGFGADAGAADLVAVQREEAANGLLAVDARFG